MHTVLKNSIRSRGWNRQGDGPRPSAERIHGKNRAAQEFSSLITGIVVNKGMNLRTKYRAQQGAQQPRSVNNHGFRLRL